MHPEAVNAFCASFCVNTLTHRAQAQAFIRSDRRCNQVLDGELPRSTRPHVLQLIRKRVHAFTVRTHILECDTNQAGSRMWIQGVLVSRLL